MDAVANEAYARVSALSRRCAELRVGSARSGLALTRLSRELDKVMRLVAEILPPPPAPEGPDAHAAVLARALDSGVLDAAKALMRAAAGHAAALRRDEGGGGWLVALDVIALVALQLLAAAATRVRRYAEAAARPSASPPSPASSIPASAASAPSSLGGGRSRPAAAPRPAPAVVAGSVLAHLCDPAWMADAARFLACRRPVLADSSFALGWQLRGLMALSQALRSCLAVVAETRVRGVGLARVPPGCQTPGPSQQPQPQPQPQPQQQQQPCSGSESSGGACAPDRRGSRHAAPATAAAVAVASSDGGGGSGTSRLAVTPAAEVACGGSPRPRRVGEQPRESGGDAPAAADAAAALPDAAQQRVAAARRLVAALLQSGLLQVFCEAVCAFPAPPARGPAPGEGAGPTQDMLSLLSLCHHVISSLIGLSATQLDPQLAQGAWYLLDAPPVQRLLALGLERSAVGDGGAATGWAAMVDAHVRFLCNAASVWGTAAATGTYGSPPMPPVVQLPRLMARGLEVLHSLAYGAAGGVGDAAGGDVPLLPPATAHTLISAVTDLFTHTERLMPQGSAQAEACTADGLAAGAWGLALALEEQAAAAAAQQLQATHPAAHEATSPGPPEASPPAAHDATAGGATEGSGADASGSGADSLARVEYWLLHLESWASGWRSLRPDGVRRCLDALARARLLRSLDTVLRLGWRACPDWAAREQWLLPFHRLGDVGLIRGLLLHSTGTTSGPARGGYAAGLPHALHTRYDLGLFLTASKMAGASVRRLQELPRLGLDAGQQSPLVVLAACITLLSAVRLCPAAHPALLPPCVDPASPVDVLCGEQEWAALLCSRPDVCAVAQLCTQAVCRAALPALNLLARVFEQQQRQQQLGEQQQSPTEQLQQAQQQLGEQQQSPTEQLQQAQQQLGEQQQSPTEQLQQARQQPVEVTTAAGAPGGMDCRHASTASADYDESELDMSFEADMAAAALAHTAACGELSASTRALLRAASAAAAAEAPAALVAPAARRPTATMPDGACAVDERMPALSEPEHSSAGSVATLASTGSSSCGLGTPVAVAAAHGGLVGGSGGEAVQAGPRRQRGGGGSQGDDATASREAVAAAAAAPKRRRRPGRRCGGADCALGDAAAAAAEGECEDLGPLLQVVFATAAHGVRQPLRKLVEAAAGGGDEEAFRRCAVEAALRVERALMAAKARRRGAEAEALRLEAAGGAGEECASAARASVIDCSSGSGGVAGGGDACRGSAQPCQAAARAPAAPAAEALPWLCGNAMCELFEGAHELLAAGSRHRCGGCRAVRYCCAACQLQHWRAGHQAECRRLSGEPR
ncbi:hypothetical protein TSOC_007352 [Tetrabaena socialis]|uniref:MYND-type domain-containing protein n=1 Tax=Tetrabaena socialis TaxID=47790 RepID=A0A2J8A1A0_9CHLO|nr:hypothetical protein TSOC_007352 [Tetrabaena socialis]|eukprot:PNH06293.1 hypothetical protein TSOC_007352 [Tetrabaena socialis]